MGFFAILSIFIATGVLSWFIAESSARRKSDEKIYSLEAKIRMAESRALGYREQFEKIQKSFTSLQSELAFEKDSKQSIVTGFQRSVKRGMIISGTVCLFAGLLFGGVVTGFTVAAQAGEKSREKLMELDIVARVSAMNAEYFKTELDALKLEYSGLRKLLDDERVAKAVALTKLEIILENLVTDKWKRGYMLDPEKFKDEWPRAKKMESPSEKAALPAPSLAF